MTPFGGIKWHAYLGYALSENATKEIACVEFWALNRNAAESYARRLAESLFDTNWGPHFRVVGPVVE